MNCPDCRDRLQQWFDARTPGAAPPVCPACAEWSVAAVRLDRGLCLLAAPAPPAHLADRIVAQVKARRRRRVRLVFAAGIVAAAATVLLAVWQSFPMGAPSRPPIVVPSIVAEAPAPEPSVPSVNLRDSVAQAGSAMASLTSRTADETVAKTKVLLVVVDPSLGQLDLQSASGPPARSLRETGESVTAGLEPVADSARRAVGLFLRELPPMDANSKTGF
jgi:hypothetical protein